jgi:hypothetical protein
MRRDQIGEYAMIDLFTTVLAVLIGNALTLVTAFFVYYNFFYQPEPGKTFNEIESERAAFARNVADNLAPEVAERVASRVRDALVPRRWD